MAKEKRQLFETISITDLLIAEDIVEESKVAIEKAEKGIKNSMVSTACMFLTMAFPSLLGSSGIGGAIAGLLALVFFVGWLFFLVKSIIVGGGFKKVLSVAGKVVYWAWLLIPVFPFDLAIALFAGFYVITVYIYVPAVCFWFIKRQAKKDLAAAEKFIERYRREMDNLGHLEGM